MKFKIIRATLAPSAQYFLFVWEDNDWRNLTPHGQWFDSESRARKAAETWAKYGPFEPIGEFECAGTDVPQSPGTIGALTTTTTTEKPT